MVALSALTPPCSEVEEYCRQKQSPYMEDKSPYMEDKVSSTCKVEVGDSREPSHLPYHPDLSLLPTSAFSPPPLKTSTPTIFRPPGLEESEEEGEEQEERRDSSPPSQYPGLCPPFPPVSYPSMLRLLQPHLYRGGLGLYHPYLPTRYYQAK